MSGVPSRHVWVNSETCFLLCKLAQGIARGCRGRYFGAVPLRVAYQYLLEARNDRYRVLSSTF